MKLFIFQILTHSVNSVKYERNFFVENSNTEKITPLFPNNNGRPIAVTFKNINLPRRYCLKIGMLEFFFFGNISFGTNVAFY